MGRQRVNKIGSRQVFLGRIDENEEKEKKFIYFRASLKTLLDLLRILRNRDARRVFHKSLCINDL